MKQAQRSTPPRPRPTPRGARPPLSSWVLAAAVSACSSGSDAPDAGHSADAGLTADAGPSPDVGPLPDVGTRTPVDPGAAAKAAVMIGSCAPDDGVFAWARRAYLDREPAFQAEVACLAQRSDGCAALEACSGLRITYNATAACDSRCVGDVFRSCDDPWELRWDCSVVGRTCDGDRGCVDPAADPPGPACDVATFQGRCEQNRPVHCDGERERRGRDCGLDGLTCRVDAELGYAGCGGVGPACTGETQPTTCTDADSLVQCWGGYVQQEFPCSTLGTGFSCQSGGALAEPRCGLDDACQSAAARCDGDTLEFCNAGRLERVSCAELGFTGCRAVGGEAVCTPSPWGP